MGGETPRTATAGPAPPDRPSPTVARRTPPFPPIPATLTPEQECHLMPLPPQRRNPSLTNADQTVTKVDTRLTKVDKTDHCQPPPQPQTPAKHGKTANPPTTPSTPLSTPAVNLSGTSRTNLNNTEQIRTTLNTAERPDQIGTPPGSPPNTQKKTTPNTAAVHMTPLPPLRKERDELGKRGVGLAVGGKCEQALPGA